MGCKRACPTCPTLSIMRKYSTRAYSSPPPSGSGRAGGTEQAAAPGASVVVPSEHTLHDMAPGRAEKVPAGHRLGEERGTG